MSVQNKWVVAVNHAAKLARNAHIAYVRARQAGFPRALLARARRLEKVADMANARAMALAFRADKEE